jgi:hypothetical protein
MTATTTDGRRNGVDTATLFATLDAVKAQPEIARFQFRATNRWISGTHNRGTINAFYGAGQENTRPVDFTFDADHPPVLSAATTARRRPSTCCTRWPPASPAVSRTSRRPAASTSRRSPRRSRRHQPARHPRPRPGCPQRVRSNPVVFHVKGEPRRRS